MSRKLEWEVSKTGKSGVVKTIRILLTNMKRLEGIYDDKISNPTSPFNLIILDLTTD